MSVFVSASAAVDASVLMGKASGINQEVCVSVLRACVRVLSALSAYTHLCVPGIRYEVSLPMCVHS